MVSEKLNPTIESQIIKPDISVSVGMPQVRTDLTPSIETFSIKGETFHEKFESIQKLNNEFVATAMHSEKIPLTRAIRLIHSKYSNTEPTPLSFTDTDKKKLQSWFLKTLPKYGISSIDDIDRNSFFPFLKVDPSIIGLFDYHESETSLGEITLRTLTDIYPGKYNFEMQRSISNFLVEIPLEKRQSNDIVRKFIETCKKEDLVKINYVSRPRKIGEVYSNILNSDQ